MDSTWQWIINNGFAVLAAGVLGRVVYVLWKKVEDLENQKCVYGATNPRKCQQLEEMMKDSSLTLHQIKKAVQEEDESSDNQTALIARRDAHAHKK